MTDRKDNDQKLARRAKTAARKLRRKAEDASEAATAENRKVAKAAYDKIKASRARAVKKD